MQSFCSDDFLFITNFGENVFETLLNSNIDCITDLNLSSNRFWFQPRTNDKPNNFNLLAELISKQTGIEHIDLSTNFFSTSATNAIVTTIADHPSLSDKL